MADRKSNRGRIQIIGDVLGLATSGIKKTHIMYRGNLSYEQAHQYLAEMIDKGLVDRQMSSECTIYRTTERGREFLAHYGKLSEFLDSSHPIAPYLSA